MGTRNRYAGQALAMVLAAALVAAIPSGASAQYGYGYGYGSAGAYVDDQIDNITVKAGAGYAFVWDHAAGDFVLGWEHLWIFGAATSVSTFQLGIDALMFVLGDEGSSLAILPTFGAAVDAKVYFGSDMSGEPTWFTFGLGAFAGAGGMWGEDEVDGDPYVVAAGEVSLQWIGAIGCWFDIYGGVFVMLLDETIVAPIHRRGARRDGHRAVVRTRRRGVSAYFRRISVAP
jgi:hypothetical protein